MSDAVLISCQLSQISRTHTKLAELINKLESPPQVVEHGRKLTRDALMTLLEIYPIAVKKLGKGYECIGGIRQFLLAQSMLQPDDEIPVLCYPGKLKPESMQRRLLVELYQLPLLMGVYQGDTRMAKVMVSSFKQLDPDLLKNLGLKIKVSKVFWSGVSERTIKRG